MKEIKITKIDKREKLGMVADTETIGKPEDKQALVYDIGYVIRNKKGQVYAQVNHLVSEIWNNKELMEKAYFNQKVPMYEKMVENREIDILPLKDIIKEMQEIAKYFNIQYFSAYNVGFDIQAIYQTVDFIYPFIFEHIPYQKWATPNYYGRLANFFTKRVLKKEIKIIDIWTKACETLCSQITFQTYYKKLTEKGNIKSNAEIVYNYLLDTNDFIEDHTALSDSLIENEILARVERTHKKTIDWVCKPYELIERVA